MQSHLAQAKKRPKHVLVRDDLPAGYLRTYRSAAWGDKTRVRQVCIRLDGFVPCSTASSSSLHSLDASSSSQAIQLVVDFFLPFGLSDSRELFFHARADQRAVCAVPICEAKSVLYPLQLKAQKGRLSFEFVGIYVRIRGNRFVHFLKFVAVFISSHEYHLHLTPCMLFRFNLRHPFALSHPAHCFAIRSICAST